MESSVFATIDSETIIAESLKIEPKKKQPAKTPRLIAIGGGKGGVGKTFFTAATGIILSSLKKKTVIVDGDFGGANLHNCMGIPNPPYSIQDYLLRQNTDLNKLLLGTQFDNLKILAGPEGVPGAASYRYRQNYNFLNSLKTIDADYVILDLGAGTSYNEIDMFTRAEQGFIIATPEPTSIQDSFYFLKLCLFRKLARRFRDDANLIDLLNETISPSAYREPYTVEKLLKAIKNYNGHAAEYLQNLLLTFKPKLVMNMVETQTDCEEGIALQIAVQELLSLTLEYGGFVPYNENVRKAFRIMEPKLLTANGNGMNTNLSKIVLNSIITNIPHSPQPNYSQLPRQKKSKAYYPFDTFQNEVICSVKCSLWGNCRAQNGGYPCRVKYIGYLNQTE